MSKVYDALMVLVKMERSFNQVVMTRLGKQWYLRAKTKALITHDRILRADNP